ncbi:hypothetical protein VTH06DRAFT_3909 [Thermothelomyces fergusii]
MLLYEDIITGDELLSDAYPIKEVDGVAYEVDAKTITVKQGADVDIGANPSAEEGDEALEEGEERVHDIRHSFRLQETQFDKKTYLATLKAYMKSVKTKLQEAGKSAEEVKEFETKASGFAKKIIANFNDYEFFTGNSMNPDGMIVLLNYREDGITPYYTFWKHGLKEVKL